ncbi:MAG TPA: acetyl-CoA carboxylase biotin carboxylase subunit, partial [Chthonomonadales bacterium]|nr:acetyl-CoA carboxylase biotin carboxylase subunit [Chthonomonadales bacterium]
NYAPSAGVVRSAIFPGGPGVRVDTHIYPGYEVPPYYDPMLAKIVTWGRTRPEAIARMARCLDELEIVGIPTNVEIQKQIIGNPLYRRGEVSTNFVATHIMKNGASSA